MRDHPRLAPSYVTAGLLPDGQTPTQSPALPMPQARVLFTSLPLFSGLPSAPAHSGCSGVSWLGGIQGEGGGVPGLWPPARRSLCRESSVGAAVSLGLSYGQGPPS